MYVLCQDDVHHTDGTTTTNLPLTVGVGEAASAFVALRSPQTARAFLWRFPMGQGYRILCLPQVPRAKLYVADLVFLMRKAGDVERRPPG